MRLLSEMKPYIPYPDLEHVVHAFTTCCFSTTATLYCGLDQSSTHGLQLLLNAAACLLTGCRNFELPVSFRIQFKVLLIVFKCLTGMALLYLSELLSVHVPCRQITSANQLTLDVSRSQLKTSLCCRDSCTMGCSSFECEDNSVFEHF